MEEVQFLGNDYKSPMLFEDEFEKENDRLDQLETISNNLVPWILSVKKLKTLMKPKKLMRQEGQNRIMYTE